MDFISISKSTFISNKYSQWYFNIIVRALSQDRVKNRGIYYEAHHILPKCIWPEYSSLEDHPWNRVLLTGKEHFICHALLTYMVERKTKYSYSLNRAFSGMKSARSGQEGRYFSARLYEMLKIRYANERKFVERSKEHCLKMSEAKKGKISIKNIETGEKLFLQRELAQPYLEAGWVQNKPPSPKGLKRSLETRKKMSENNAMKNPENRAKISRAHKGRMFTEEHRMNMGKKRKGIVCARNILTGKVEKVPTDLFLVRTELIGLNKGKGKTRT